MEFLAGDALNGRGSGTRDEWLAASYIGSHMRRLGIEPLGDDGGYVQTITVSRNVVTAPPALTIGELQFKHGAEMLAQTLGAAGVAGRLVHLGDQTRVTPDAIVLLPEGAAPGERTAVAAAVLSVETPQLRARWPQLAGQMPAAAVRLMTRGQVVPSRQTRIVLSREAYDAVNQLADGAPVKLDLVTSTQTSGATYNAVGRLPGSDPAAAGEIILLTAHLDHLGVRGTGGDPVYNGADDDASGSTAVLALAEAIVKGPRPRRTVVFAWFGSEEAGGYGATAFVALPPAPHAQIVANLEFEMIGRPDPLVPQGVLWLTGHERTNLGPELAAHGARLVADPHPEQNFFQRSDNIQLARSGVVAQTVSSFGLHTDYHRPSDEVKTIDFAHMTEAIRSMLGPIRWLADSGFKPEWLPGKKP
jgi:hypothetical protein